MNRNRTQFARLVALDERIRANRYPNCTAFAAQWEVSRKTVQRDVDYLKYQLGAPLEYDAARRGFFYRDSNWFLPAMEMTEGDLVSLLVGARALAQYRGTPVAAKIGRVFARIAEMLPERLSIRPEEVFSSFSFTGPPSKPVNEAVWTTLVRGLLNRRTVEIRYRAFDADKTTQRRLDPYHIANLQGEWYVFGFCELKREVRQFAIPRVERARLLDRTFVVPPEFRAADRIGAAFSRFAAQAPVRHVRLLFEKSAEPWLADCQWHPSQRLTRRYDGRLVLSFHATGLLEIKRWVLGWGREVGVIAPRELRLAVEEEVQAMANNLKGQAS